jgi:hypothetical protein
MEIHTTAKLRYSGVSINTKRCMMLVAELTEPLFGKRKLDVREVLSDFHEGPMVNRGIDGKMFRHSYKQEDSLADIIQVVIEDDIEEDGINLLDYEISVSGILSVCNDPNSDELYYFIRPTHINI